MSTDRIETLERAVAQLAQCLATTAQAVVAQGVVTRAAIDLATEGGGTLDAVRDRAITMSNDMPDGIEDAVRLILAEVSDGRSRVQ